MLGLVRSQDLREFRIARCNVAPVPSTGEPCQAFQAGRAHPTSLELALHHRHLRDVDRAAAEPTLAIHEIVAPKIVEGLFEALQRTARDGLIVALPPPL